RAMTRASASVLALLVVLAACGSNSRDGFEGQSTLPNGAGPNNGVGGDCGNVQCGLGTVCVPGKGCLPCAPGQDSCVGNEVHQCSDQGQVGALVQTCDP